MAVCAHCSTDNPPGAKFCVECGAALPPSSIPADRRPVTALFCDLVGSTRLGEQLDAEALRVVMHEYYEAMRGALERHGGSVEKFIGDAVVAVFGVPVVHEDDALRAARAALEMHGAILGVNQRLAGYGAALEIRIGIQSGEVVVGEEASLVGGDTFNTAARLQAVAAPGETIVGEASQRLLVGVAELEPIPPLRLAGKAQSVTAFRLTSADARRPVRLAAPLIGRDRALDTLVRAFENAAADSACVLATVLGAPGIGKTRLAEELITRLSGEATVLFGQTAAYGEGRTYGAVIDLLYAVSGVRDGDPAAAARALRELLRGLVDAHAVGERLADLLGVGSGTAAGETSWAVRRLLERLAEVRPLVVVLDDVHWADVALLDLIDAVAERVRGPILLLCLARPELLEVRPTWAGGKTRAVTLTLDPLEDTSACELAELLLGGRAGDELAARIAGAAEGNPLYVEQYVAALADGSSTEEWSAPPALQALLAARLDRLERADADLLSTAAVQGHEFVASTLAALLGAPDPAGVLATLDGLERRDLVRRADGGPERWTFAHGLLREAAERRLPKRVRADLHVRLAELAKAGCADDDEVLGLHYERAAILRTELGFRDAETEWLEESAARHLAAVGNRAFARLDLLGAANLLGRADRLLPPSSPDRLALATDLGAALTETGRPEDAVRLLEQAIAEAGATGHEAQRLRAAVQLLAARIYLEPADAALEQARADAAGITRSLERLGDSVGLAQALVLVEYLAWMRGVADTGACLRAVEHACVSGRLREEMQAVGDLAFYVQVGPATPDEIEALAARVAGPADQIVEAAALALRCVAAGLRGDVAAFGELDRAVLAILDALGLEFLRAVYAAAVAESLITLGRAAEAEHRLREGCERMRAAGDVWWEHDLGMLRVGALQALGDVAGAEALVESLAALEAPQTTHMRIVRAMTRSRALLRRGRLAEARAEAVEAVGIASQTGLLVSHGEALESLAAVEAARGREIEARAALEGALSLYERKGSVPHSTRVRALLSSVGGAAIP